FLPWGGSRVGGASARGGTDAPSRAGVVGEDDPEAAGGAEVEPDRVGLVRVVPGVAERLGDAVAVDDVRELLAAAGVVREVRGADVLEAGEGGALLEELAGGVAGGLGAVRVSGDGVHGVPPRRVDPGPSRLRCYDLTSYFRGSL